MKAPNMNRNYQTLRKEKTIRYFTSKYPTLELEKRDLEIERERERLEPKKKLFSSISYHDLLITKVPINR